MIAKNMAELESAIMKKMRSAMQEAQTQAEADMKEAIDFFYSGGKPEMYQRTAQLRGTPRTSGIVAGGVSGSSSGNRVGFEAYLSKDGGYTTGANPSMSDVLDLTNSGKSQHGLRRAAGSPGYWEKAEEQIKQSAMNAMAKQF